MKYKRREFLKRAGLGGLAGLTLNPGYAALGEDKNKAISPDGSTNFKQMNTSIIGLYGPWAADRRKTTLPSLSFRNKEWPELEAWRTAAKKLLTARLAIPDLGKMPRVTVRRKYTFDDLQVEELSWQLPYGRPTDAVLLSP